ncbi:VOC family protein [Ferrovibrio terrae]|uniref:VOC family protein n=1 Tax=Ferrovibrio terrae TaxID=2594003 RepID=A0A516GZ37_9PROT|nr:VOC family protein [Ferrovibrio terrae]QDO96755.1 VOC family protein [Ferrovibrio terrae]
MIKVHAYIEVTTAEDGIAFYCDGLGLKLKRQYSQRWIELAGANTPVFLLASRTPTADLGDRMVERNYDRHWTPVHLDFVVDDLDTVLARLLERGGRLDRPVKSRDYGRIANMADPFGNGFDLIEFSGSGYENLPL